MITWVDTDVVLDVLLGRKPFVNNAVRVFGLIERGQVEGLLCATTVTTIDYLLTQTLSRSESIETIRRLLWVIQRSPRQPARSRRGVKVGSLILRMRFWNRQDVWLEPMRL